MIMEGNDSGSGGLHSSPVSRVDYSVIVAILVFIFILWLKHFLSNYKNLWYFVTCILLSRLINSFNNILIVSNHFLNRTPLVLLLIFAC